MVLTSPSLSSPIYCFRAFVSLLFIALNIPSCNLTLDASCVCFSINTKPLIKSFCSCLASSNSFLRVWPNSRTAISDVPIFSSNLAIDRATSSPLYLPILFKAVIVFSIESTCFFMEALEESSLLFKLILLNSTWAFLRLFDALVKSFISLDNLAVALASSKISATLLNVSTFSVVLVIFWYVKISWFSKLFISFRFWLLLLNTFSSALYWEFKFVNCLFNLSKPLLSTVSNPLSSFWTSLATSDISGDINLSDLVNASWNSFRFWLVEISSFSALTNALIFSTSFAETNSWFPNFSNMANDCESFITLLIFSISSVKLLIERLAFAVCSSILLTSSCFINSKAPLSLSLNKLVWISPVSFLIVADNDIMLSSESLITFVLMIPSPKAFFI